LSPTDDPRAYTAEMLVAPKGPIDGKTIEEAGLRHLTGMYLAEVERDGEVFAAVGPHLRLRGNDQLVFVGVVESVVSCSVSAASCPRRAKSSSSTVRVPAAR
jgi:Trk K+ transport system NAD-binding subunit